MTEVGIHDRKEYEGAEELISVIVPVYNVQEYLSRCVDSILRQTYRNLELILVDDGSKDSSGSICDRYQESDSRVRAIHQENAGVSAARNRGIGECRGKFLTFIDADDWIDEDYLELLYLALTSNCADLSAMGHTREICGGYQHNAICHSEEVLSKEEALDQAMDAESPWVGFAWGKLLRRDVIDENGLQFDTGIGLCEDSLFHYGYIDKAETAVKIPACGYHYFIRDDSATRTAGTNYKNLKSKILAFEKARIIASRYPGSEFKKRIDATLFSALISYLSTLFSHGIYDEKEITFVRERVGKLEKEVEFKRLGKGVYIRYRLYKSSPRLLFCFEWFRMHI